MNNFQFFLFFLIFVLIFNESSRNDALVLFAAYCVYQFFIVELDAIYYYSCTALLHLCSGLVLHYQNKLAAICSYSIVIVNALGFWLWYQYMPPSLYNNIAITILVIQVAAIAPKRIFDEFRYNSQLFTANAAHFNRAKFSAKMFTNQKTQESNQ